MRMSFSAWFKVVYTHLFNRCKISTRASSAFTIGPLEPTHSNPCLSSPSCSTSVTRSSSENIKYISTHHITEVILGAGTEFWWNNDKKVVTIGFKHTVCGSSGSHPAVYLWNESHLWSADTLARWLKTDATGSNVNALTAWRSGRPTIVVVVYFGGGVLGWCPCRMSWQYRSVVSGIMFDRMCIVVPVEVHDVGFHRTRV